MERDTAIIGLLKREYEKRGRVGSSDEKESFLNRMKDGINQIYSSKEEDWEEKVVGYIKRECSDLGRRKNGEEKKNEVGIIHYSLLKNKQEFLNYGIGEPRDVIELHIDKLYRKEGDDFSVKKIRDSLGKVASLIVKEYPSVGHVIARSWLIDSSLAKAFGFEIIEKTNSLSHFSTWWQFIDKNGQIDKNRFRKFIETGQLPFKVALGKIEVEDFLRKFLPQEERGEIILKELPPEAIEIRKSLRQFEREFVKKFDSAPLRETLKLFSENEIFSKLEKDGDLDELIEFLIKMRKRGYSWGEVESNWGEELNGISKKLLPKVGSLEYVEKKIFIE